MSKKINFGQIFDKTWLVSSHTWLIFLNLIPVMLISKDSLVCLKCIPFTKIMWRNSEKEKNSNKKMWLRLC